MFLLNQEGPNCVVTLISSLTEREISCIPEDSLDKCIDFIESGKCPNLTSFMFQLRIN